MRVGYGPDVAVLAALLAQAAQATPAATPHPEAWVAIALAAIAMAGNIVLAVVRRGSNNKAATAEKDAKSALSIARGFQAEIATLKDYSEEHEARINDLDERISNTDPHLRPRDDRLSKLEGMITEEKAAREARHREQAAQELKLVATLTRMETNLENLKERVEDISNGRRRS